MAPSESAQIVCFQGRALPLGLVLSYISYGARCGVVHGGENGGVDVDEEGEVEQNRLAEPPSWVYVEGEGRDVRGTNADVDACLAGALREALEHWDQETGLFGQLSTGAERRAGSGRGLIGKVDMDGSIDLFTEAVSTTSGAVARVRVYADVSAALANLGSSQSSSELWRMVSKALLKVPLKDFEAKTVTCILNALARSRQLRGLPDAESASQMQQHLLEATRSGIFGIVAGVSGNNGWPVEDAGTVTAILNSLSRNELFDEALFLRLAQHIQALPLPDDDGDRNGGELKAQPDGPMTLQQCSIVANAFARAEIRDPALSAWMGALVLRLASNEHTSGKGREAVHSIALLANAFARLGEYEQEQGEAVMHALADMLAGVDPRDISPLQTARISNAWAKAQIRDERLWEQLSAAVASHEPASFGFRAVANIMHAMAVVHVIDLQLLTFLEQRLLNLPLESSTPQGIANVAWSVAVLHPIFDLNSNRRSIKDNASDGRLAERLAALIRLHAGKFDKSCFSQVHQYLISISPPADYDGSTPHALSRRQQPTADGELARLSLEAFRQGTIDVSGSSGQQAEVGRALQALGIEVVSEFVDPLTGYSYDFWLPADGIALEFDGMLSRSLARAQPACLPPYLPPSLPSGLTPPRRLRRMRTYLLGRVHTCLLAASWLWWCLLWWWC